MPFWLQIVIAVIAGGIPALAGMALVPYLRKLRFFPPEPSGGKPEAASEAAGEERKPLMGGLLLLSGIVFAMVPGIALFLQFGDCDRTSKAFAEQTELLSGAGIYAALLTAGGILTDLSIIRGRGSQKLREWILLPLVMAAMVLTMALVKPDVFQTKLWLWAAAIPLSALCFSWENDLEHDTDGALITVNAVELLVLTMLLLREFLYLPALLTLACAGACFGCMVWCLHPAKCRLGRTGAYLLGGVLPFLCLWLGMYKELALFMAVFLLQQLYRLRKHENKYLTEGMAESGIQPLARIAILAGLAAFCGLMALLLK